MSNIFMSSFVLYLGDSMMVLLLITGTWFATLSAIKLTHRFVIIDISERTLKLGALFAIAITMANLIAFKFLLLSSGPNYKALGTGNHGSVQFSTAGECVAGLLMIFGIYGWCRTITRHIRLAAT